MNWLMTLYVVALFYVLVPGVLVSLPPKGSKMVVALTHAVVFALVFHFTHKLVWNAVSQYSMDGFQDASGNKMAAKPLPAKAAAAAAKPATPA